MTENITYSIKYALTTAITCCIIVMISAGASAWTRASLSSVDVNLKVEKEGTSIVTTKARFTISAGRFHGFDLAPQKDLTLVEKECHATMNRHKYSLGFTKLFDGRTRVTLANSDYVKSGSIEFSLVHTTSLAETGSLVEDGNRVRLDWTPIIWDHGTDYMTVTVELPQSSLKPEIRVDSDVTSDYEIIRNSNYSISFKKIRTVKWYPMQVVIDFSPEVVKLENRAQLTTKNNIDKKEKSKTSSVISSFEKPKSEPPFFAASMPAIIVLLGLLLSVWKTLSIQRAHREMGFKAKYRFLRKTGGWYRFMLALLSAGFGLVAIQAGSIAASVPALAASASLWLMERIECRRIPRAGGAWRPMAEDESDRYKRILSAYRRRRKSFLDISTACGVASFVIASASLIYAVWILKNDWPHMAFASAISGVIWIIPVWFSFTHSELPVDPTVETFSMLEKWKKDLVRLTGKLSPDAKATFWLREDDRGPIEVRLRVTPPPADLLGLEVAAEVVKSQTVHKVRKVAILKMDPGTETARKLANCPGAAEHHLTADLKQEIIVLRNRRGKKEAGLSPLKSALALLHT